MVKYEKSFSEFEVKESSIKFNKESDVTSNTIGCVGSFEEELDTKSITKKCEGVVVKNVTKCAGSGTIKVSLHIRNDIYMRMLGMNDSKLKNGVYGYGKDSIHEPFTYLAKVLDEDGVTKYVAYPNCVLSSGPSSKIENGAEEVSEREVEINLAIDNQGYIKYECLAEELDESDENLGEQWMKQFNYDLIKATNALGI